MRDRYWSVEFVLVIAIAFGWAILISVGALLSGPTLEDAPSTGSTFGKGHLYGVVITELMCIPVIAAVLHVRGWRLQDFPIGIGSAATALGVLIAISAWVMNAAIYTGLEQLFPQMRAGLDAVEPYRPSNPPDFVAVYIVSIVNPVFEEVIVCGYVIAMLSRRFGQSTAVNASVVIRSLYHLYQGIAALPFHLAYGLLQAYTYVRVGKLWPLIVSHALLDFFALLHYV